jgi:hypothetical protein
MFLIIEYLIKTVSKNEKPRAMFVLDVISEDFDLQYFHHRLEPISNEEKIFVLPPQ